jgi:hypothetical protein
MWRTSGCIWVIAFFVSCGVLVQAQDLAPRAYVITPLHSNAVIVTYGYFNGSVLFNGAAPVSGATGSYHVPILSYYHSFDMWGHSANVTGSLPYAVGTFQGQAIGVDQQIYRSGLLDTTFRLAVNLRGGPAMQVSEFGKWQEKSLLGVSMKVVAPTGQYDPTKLVNWGSNRWSFKPEVGYSRRRRHMVLDGYAGVWLFVKNDESFSPAGPQPQTEQPVYSFEGHLSYDLKPRLWFSLDGNFWIGGLAELNGVDNPATRQTSSRVGATASLPFGKYRHSSVKVSYSNDLYVRFGGNYQNVSVAWQYSWLGRPQ